MTVSFEIPGEAIAFARAGSNGARRFTPEPQASYMRGVAMMAKRAMAGRPLLAGPLSLRIRCHYVAPASWSARKRAATVYKVSVPDLSNIAKLLEDAMNGIVYKDDAQVAELVVSKLYAPSAGVHVTIESLEGE